MFSKPANAPRSDHSDSPAPNRRPMAASLVAENVTIKGDVVSDGDVHLDGLVEGDVHVGHLTIGETGEVKGAIENMGLSPSSMPTDEFAARVARERVEWRRIARELDIKA